MYEDVIRLREDNRGYKEIAKLTGLDRDKVRAICLRAGLGGRRGSARPEFRQEKTCRWCGKTFIATHGNQKYCSPECRQQYVEDKKLGEKQSSEKTCPVCGTVFTVNSSSHKYCSERCQRKAAYAKKKGIALSRAGEKICPVCKTPFITTNAHKIFCSKRCQRIVNRYKYGDCDRSLRYDERLRKCTTIDKYISLRALILRDNNTCAICGGKCDLYDYSVTEHGSILAGPNHPSIDHIVPLSKGGQHTWANIQLAHRRCNTQKGANNEI